MDALAKRFRKQTFHGHCSLIAVGCASSDIAAGSTVLSGVGTPDRYRNRGRRRTFRADAAFAMPEIYFSGLLGAEFSNDGCWAFREIINSAALLQRPADERIDRKASSDNKCHMECKVYDNRAPHIYAGVHMQGVMREPVDEQPSNRQPY